jgi:hypothetical protein
MSITFPDLKPSSRSMTLGVYPIKVYRSQAGTTVKRSFGNKAYGYQLRLAFANRRDRDILQIVRHYEKTEAGFERFDLPASTFAGVTTTGPGSGLRGMLRSPDSCLWEYAEPPQIEWVGNEISTITVSLVAELNV